MIGKRGTVCPGRRMPTWQLPSLDLRKLKREQIVDAAMKWHRLGAGKQQNGTGEPCKPRTILAMCDDCGKPPQRTGRSAASHSASAAQSKRPRSMRDSTGGRWNGAVARQLQRLVGRRYPETGRMNMKRTKPSAAYERQARRP